MGQKNKFFHLGKKNDWKSFLDKKIIAEGRELMGGDGLDCTNCHTFHRSGKPKAPDLTGYGSREWMLGIIHDPSHDRFYGSKNDRMPAFGADAQLTRRQMESIVDWLRGE